VVKSFLLLFLVLNTLFAQDALYDKIESFIGKNEYKKNQGFIEIIFKNEDSFFKNDRVDAVKVIETLKNNGLLKLYFKKPKYLQLTFYTNGSALFFVTLMGDTLRSIGYYSYLTQYSKNSSREFVWQIGLTSEYMTDPVILRKELLKRGCDIIDINKKDESAWEYTIDMSQAHLDAVSIKSDEKILLRRSLTPHWMNVSESSRVKLTSLGSNSWYPYIAFFDSKLRLLRVYKRDKKTWQIKIKIPNDAVYAKVTDLYNLKNIKDGLEVESLNAK
jgi:hypothetical protein